MTDSAISNISSVPEDHPRLIAARYELMKKLGAGGMGEVHLARDRATGASVAVKLMLDRHVDEAAVKRFRREIRHMKELAHPNIVTILDDGETEGGAPFLVMEYVTGGTLSDFIRRQPDQRLLAREVPGVFIPLADALGHLHNQRLIHRDLKPANVMLATVGDAEIVKLMDFGLARRVAGSQEITALGVTVGTVQYMAPEQISGLPLDARADLYALGVMLYEAVVGVLPFEAETTTGIILKHLQANPLPPSRHVPGLPADLERIILKLLAKDAGERFASAGEVMDALGHLDFAPGVVIPADLGELGRGLLRPPLVGRAPAVTRLTELLTQVMGGQSRFVALTGPLGAGKSRLLEEFSGTARMLGARIFKAACTRQGVALEPIVKILRALHPQPAPADFESTDAQILAALWPAVTQVLGATTEGDNASPTGLTTRPINPPLPTLPPDLEKARLYDCLARQFVAAARPHPVVLVIEDGQWGDEPTLAFLAYLLRRVAEANSPVLVCGAFNAEDRETNPALVALLRDLTQAHTSVEVTLSALTAAEVSEMLAGMLGHALPALAEQLYLKTGGSPQFIEELVRALVDEGHLQFDDGAWQWNGGGLQATAVIADVIKERLERLKPEDQRALAIAALIGREFDFDVLAAAAQGEFTEDQLLDSTDAWLARQLVRDLTPEHFAFTQLLIQDEAAKLLHGPRLSRAHRKVAEAIVTRRSGQLDQFYGSLASHYSVAGDYGRAFDYMVRAGEQTARRSAYAEAARLLTTAEALMLKAPPSGIATQIQLYEALGNALERAGEYAAATGAFERGQACLAADPSPAGRRSAAEFGLRAARVLGLHGQYAAGLAKIAEARQLAAEGEDQALRARISNQEVALLYRQGEDARAEALAAQTVADLQGTPHTRELAEALNALGVLRDVAGRLAEAVETYEACLALWQALGDDYQRVRTQQNLAIVLRYLGRLAEARQLDEAALAFWEKMDAPNQVALAHNNLGETDLLVGQLESAEAHYTRAREIWLRLGDPLYTITVTLNLATVRAEREELSSARWLANSTVSQSQEAGTDEYLPDAYRLLAHIHMLEGELEAALDFAQKSLALAQTQNKQLDEALAERAWGVALRAAGQLPEARPHLERSLELLQAVNSRPEIGRAQLELARWHQANDDFEAMFLAALEAKKIFDELGMKGELKKVKALGV